MGIDGKWLGSGKVFAEDGCKGHQSVGVAMQALSEDVSSPSLSVPMLSMDRGVS